MTRWGIVGVLVVAAACGGKKDDKPTDKSGAAGSPAAAKVKLGADEATCGPVLAKVSEIYRAWDSGHAYGMMLDNPKGEHYRKVHALCTKWSSAKDRDCVTGAKDYDALEACRSSIMGNYAAIEDARAVAACGGGVVDKLDCPDGAWSNGTICVPAPPGFTANVKEWDGGAEGELTYPDGTAIKIGWSADDEDCDGGESVLEEKYFYGEIHAECRWPSGAFAVYTEERGRRGRARLCGENAQARCQVVDAPALEAACAGLQLVGDPGAAPPSGGTRDEAKMPLSEGKMGKRDSDRAEGEYKMRAEALDEQLAAAQALDKELGEAMEALASAATAEEREAAKARVEAVRTKMEALRAK